jgi:hypothetical protein
VSGMDGAIGIWRSVVEDKFIIARCCSIILSRFSLPLIQIVGAFLAVRFQLGSARSRWKG